jgi:DNA-binding NarL/FixJ family response regulator
VPRTSILLADDNVAVLDHVRKILENNYEIVGAVHDGESVLRDWALLKAALIILDISMGDPNGIEVARRLRDSGCNSRIVFLTVHQDPDFVKAALEAGGSAYVVKSRMWKDLAPAIDAVLSGKHFVSPTTAKIKPEPLRKATG